MRIKVFICDDDPDMRLVIKKVVEEVEEVEVVGEAGDGFEAEKLIEDLSPQIIFLDIDMPGKDGIELGKAIFDLNPWTFIVYVTGFNEYRDEAFDIYAFDYLVKPFKLNRLRQTMVRIKAILEGKREAGADFSEIARGTGTLEKTRLFKASNEFICLNVDNIIFITKESRKTVVYHTEGVFVTNESLSALAEKLQGDHFLRSHKGFIVNLQMVKKIIPYGRDSYELVMAHTEKRPLLTWENSKKLGLFSNLKG
ncbi:MAG: LytTR family DNA-binding domain-containing protein [Desulfotomaculaceae bacterium]|nr:LytTR family DNA-binding domain-containing protein [Desulfotomaculaceae bacterium]